MSKVGGNRKTPVEPTDWELGNELQFNAIEVLQSEAAKAKAAGMPELAELMKSWASLLRPVSEWLMHDTRSKAEIRARIQEYLDNVTK